MLPNNTTFDVYRGFAPATPYNPPQRPAVLAGLQGYLHQHVRNGRFGYYPSGEQAPLYWTTVLDVPTGTDARDAYATQLNSDTIQNGDTVMVYDYPIPGTCCAFVASFVQRRNRAQTSGLQSIDFIRLYLDRAQPQWLQTCPDPNATDGGGGNITVPCCSVPIPDTLFLTLVAPTGCTCVAGTYTLAYNTSNTDWRYTGSVCGWNALFRLSCSNNIWNIQIGSTAVWATNSMPISVQCSPFEVSYNPIELPGGLTAGCGGPTFVTPTVSQ